MLRLVIVGRPAYVVAAPVFADAATGVPGMKQWYATFSRGAGTVALMDDHGRGPGPKRCPLPSWTFVDGITPRSWERGQFTSSEWRQNIDTRAVRNENAAGPFVVDGDYILKCDNWGVCEVWTDRDRNGFPEQPAGGAWEFRNLTTGADFDNPAGNTRQFLNADQGQTIEAEDGDGEYPTIAGRMPYNDVYPYMPSGAVFGIGSPIETGVQRSPYGQFHDGVVYIGAEGAYPCNGDFSGQPPVPLSQDQGCNYAQCRAHFGRPPTLLLNDDGYSTGYFLVGVEVKFVEVGRRSGAVMQETGPKLPDNLNFCGNQASGAAAMVEKAWLQIEQDIGEVSAFLPAPPWEGQATGQPCDRTPISPRSPLYAPVGADVDVYLWRGGMPNVHPDDPNSAYPDFRGVPGDARTCVANPFHVINTTWKYRAVYIRRDVRGVGPEGDTAHRTRIGEGGSLYYSDWQRGSFAYCPHTNAAALTVSPSAAVEGVELFSAPEWSGGAMPLVVAGQAPIWQGQVVSGYEKTGEGLCEVYRNPKYQRDVCHPEEYVVKYVTEPTTVKTGAVVYSSDACRTQSGEADYGYNYDNGGAPVAHSDFPSGCAVDGTKLSQIKFSWGAVPGADGYYVVGVWGFKNWGGYWEQFETADTFWEVPERGKPSGLSVWVYPHFPAGAQGATNEGGSCPPRGNARGIDPFSSTYHPLLYGGHNATWNGLGAIVWPCGPLPQYREWDGYYPRIGQLCGTPPDMVELISREADPSGVDLAGMTFAHFNTPEWRGCSGEFVHGGPADPPPDANLWPGTVMLWQLSPQEVPPFAVWNREGTLHDTVDGAVFAHIVAFHTPDFTEQMPLGSALAGYEQEDQNPAAGSIPGGWLIPFMYTGPVYGWPFKAYICSDDSIAHRNSGGPGVAEALQDFAAEFYWRKQDGTDDDSPTVAAGTARREDGFVGWLVKDGQRVNVYDRPQRKE